MSNLRNGEGFSHLIAHGHMNDFRMLVAVWMILDAPSRFLETGIGLLYGLRGDEDRHPAVTG